MRESGVTSIRGPAGSGGLPCANDFRVQREENWGIYRDEFPVFSSPSADLPGVDDGRKDE